MTMHKIDLTRGYGIHHGYGSTIGHGYGTHHGDWVNHENRVCNGYVVGSVYEPFSFSERHIDQWLLNMEKKEKFTYRPLSLTRVRTLAKKHKQRLSRSQCKSPTNCIAVRIFRVPIREKIRWGHPASHTGGSQASRFGVISFSFVGDFLKCRREMNLTWTFYETHSASRNRLELLIRNGDADVIATPMDMMPERMGFVDYTVRIGKFLRE